MKIKKYLPAILIVLGVIVILVFLSTKKNPAPTVATETTKIFFYGDTCPHCKNVEAYMAENGTRDKLAFQELEVYNNQSNAQKLIQTAGKCGMSVDEGVGVPLFYDGAKCLLGDQDIINYFQQL